MWPTSRAKCLHDPQQQQTVVGIYNKHITDFYNFQKYKTVESELKELREKTKIQNAVIVELEKELELCKSAKFALKRQITIATGEVASAKKQIEELERLRKQLALCER